MSSRIGILRPDCLRQVHVARFNAGFPDRKMLIGRHAIDATVLSIYGAVERPPPVIQDASMTLIDIAQAIIQLHDNPRISVAVGAGRC